MTGFIPDIIKIAARNLRKEMTESEKILWLKLKNRKLGHKFLRQKPIYLYNENSGQERYIIPDFSCLEIKIVLEIDGSIHNKKEIYSLDMEKEKLLIKKGFNILRIKNEEIYNNIENVIEKIVASFP